MLETLTLADGGLLAGFFSAFKNYLLIFVGFSLVIFFHELGHFIAAKLCNVRVEKFAIGFGKELFGFTRGETRYAFNILPLGGYVKMLGQEDFAVDKSGEIHVKDDPRAFTHKPIGQRMFIVSAGVVMNLVFAALVFMLVFMIGMKMPPAEVGWILPDSPAELSGLQVGDRILEVHGQEVADFTDVMPAVMLADPAEPFYIKVARPDQEGGEAKVLDLEVQPEKDRDENRLQIGVGPPYTTKVLGVSEDPHVRPEEQLKPGDLITAVNGQPVSDFWHVYIELGRLRGEWADLTVTRTENGQDKTLHVKRRAMLFFRPTSETRREEGHLLGLVPRRAVWPEAGGQAAKAGIKGGDVLVRWGNQLAPNAAEVNDSVRSNPDQDIKVVVLRPQPGGEPKTLELTVRPKGKGFFGPGVPRVGLDLGGQETERLIVADIVTNIDKDMKTPAAALAGIMSRGSLITKVNDQPVKTWRELADRFKSLAGSDVKLTWTYEGQPEQSGSIHIPQTLSTALHLSPEQYISKIDGLSSIEVMENGTPVTYRTSMWKGAREILRQRVGKTIEVEYRTLRDPQTQTATITVTPEMLDNWTQRVVYQVIENLMPQVAFTTVQVPNPAKAMLVGLKKTFYFIEQIYLMMQRMIITRTVGFEQMSGPVGIVKLGSEVANEGITKLLYFLALISANLAVINFLPLPIVDGGLLVFLLIEKIKGKPISIKVQMATQVIGLVLIIGVFIFVTFQDVQRLFG